MKSPSRTLPAVAGFILLAAALFAADGETKDKVSKGADGWYTVEFQVGAGKMKVDFPGEPKLESDPKAAGERTYSYTNPKSGRRYWIQVTDGNKGKILPDKDDGTTAEVIFLSWKKDDPRYKNPSRAKTGYAGKELGFEIDLDEGKEKGHSHQFILVREGCLILIGDDKGSTDAEEARFLKSFAHEKGAEAKIDVPKVEVPAGWKEFDVGKTGLKVYAPVELKWAFNGSGGDVGAHQLLLKEGTKNLFEVKITKAKDPKDLEGNKPGILGMVPNRAVKTTLGGVNGICTFKDGKPVSSDAKFGNFAYYAWVGNFYVSVECKSDAVSAADAEKVAALIVQQLKDMTKP